MKIICRKIFSHATGEDLGLKTHALKVGNEYIVLTMSYSKHNGIYIAIETENHSTAKFHLKGFEFLSDYIPSSWVTDVEEYNGIKYINMIPASWNYESFFDDFEDEEPHAMKLFKEESEKIYREEEEYCLAQAGKNV